MHRTGFSLPLTSPLQTARGEVREREGFLVGLDPETDGVTRRGVGEATPLAGWTESLNACADALELAAESARPTEFGASLDRTPAARHALSVARLDAAARASGVPLAEHLRAAHELPRPATSVRVNATVGDGSPSETVTAARRATDAGFTAVKVKVGARSVEADLDRLRAVRGAVGPDVELRADANGAWDRRSAQRALDAMGSLALDVTYVEQPLECEDLDGHAQLRESSTVGIGLDESITRYGVGRVIDADVADVVVLKPMALGGPDRAVAAAVRARSAGIEPVVTTTIDAVVARTAAVHVAAAVPDVPACGLATGNLLGRDLIDNDLVDNDLVDNDLVDNDLVDNDRVPDPAPVVDGAISVPSASGVAGTAFDDLVFPR